MSAQYPHRDRGTRPAPGALITEAQGRAVWKLVQSLAGWLAAEPYDPGADAMVAALGVAKIIGGIVSWLGKGQAEQVWGHLRTLSEDEWAPSIEEALADARAAFGMPPRRLSGSGDTFEPMDGA